MSINRILEAVEKPQTSHYWTPTWSDVERIDEIVGSYIIRVQIRASDHRPFRKFSLAFVDERGRPAPIPAPLENQNSCDVHTVIRSATMDVLNRAYDLIVELGIKDAERNLERTAGPAFTNNPAYGKKEAVADCKRYGKTARDKAKKGGIK